MRVEASRHLNRISVSLGGNRRGLRFENQLNSPAPHFTAPARYLPETVNINSPFTDLPRSSRRYSWLILHSRNRISALERARFGAPHECHQARSAYFRDWTCGGSLMKSTPRSLWSQVNRNNTTPSSCLVKPYAGSVETISLPVLATKTNTTKKTKPLARFCDQSDKDG